MKLLTISQVARELDVTPYTIKRWYNFIDEVKNYDVRELDKLVKEGMPVLPEYAVTGTRNDRLWNEEDIEDLKAFKEWVPTTKNGIFQKYKSKGE